MSFNDVDKVEKSNGGLVFLLFFVSTVIYINIKAIKPFL